MPDWLLKQVLTTAVLYFISLLLLGTNFWLTLIITTIAWGLVALDYARQYIMLLGGVMVTIIFLRWAGYDKQWVVSALHVAGANVVRPPN